MASKEFCDLPTIRKSLGLSQSEFAKLLGLSIRAVQSYEQGWRPTPIYVQKLAAALLFLNWRKTRKSIKPCWKTNNCDPDSRATCQTYQMRAGDLCWMLGQTCHHGPAGQPADEKLHACRQCAVTKPWLV